MLNQIRKYTLVCCVLRVISKVSVVISKSRNAAYLLGMYVEEILGLKLPSNRQALGHYLYRHVEEKKTIREAVTVERTTGVVLEFQSAINRIDLRNLRHYSNVGRHWRKMPQDVQKHSIKMKQNSRIVLEICSTDALNIIKIEDKAFLIAQREKGHRGEIY